MTFCLNSVSNRVYCRGLASSRLTIVDGVTDSITRLTIPHGGPGAFAYNATSNLLYVGCDDEGTVVVVDGAADTILSELYWSPVGHHHVLESGDESSLLRSPLTAVFVIDCQTNQVRARWLMDPFDEWCYSPATGRVYTGNSSNVWVFSPRGDSLLATISQGARSLCTVPLPDKVYMARARVYVLNGSSSTIVDTIPFGGGGVAMVCDPSKRQGLRLWAAYVFSTPGLIHCSRGFRCLLPARPGSAGEPLDGRVYVTDYMGDSVYVLRDTAPVSPKPAGWPPSAGMPCRCAGPLSWPGPGVGQVLDVAGRWVADVRPGVNDIGRLPTGVYTVVSARVGATVKFVKLD